MSSSYFGRFGFDEATDVAVDTNGFVYVAGWTESFAFPPTGFDPFVVKLTPDGSQIVYTKFLRGSAFDIASETYRYAEPLTVAGILFLLLALAIAQAVKRLEQKLLQATNR